MKMKNGQKGSLEYLVASDIFVEMSQRPQIL